MRPGIGASSGVRFEDMEAIDMETQGERYFAYGTLLDERAMVGYCPQAVSIGVGEVSGFAVSFGRHAGQMTGGCNLVESPAGRVMGLVYSLPFEQARDLDHVSGGGDGYYVRRPVVVRDRTGVMGECWTYVMPGTPESFRPSDEYVKRIVVGARRAALPAGYRRRLEQRMASLTERPNEEASLQASDREL